MVGASFTLAQMNSENQAYLRRLIMSHSDANETF